MVESGQGAVAGTGGLNKIDSIQKLIIEEEVPHNRNKSHEVTH